MVFKFRLISDEEKDFVRDIEVLSEQTFYDLHSVMVEDFHYDKSQLSSFFLTTHEWEKQKEFTLFDMSEDRNHHTMLMDKSVLGNFIKDPRQRLLYLFDMFNERVIYIELTDIFKNEPNVKYPRITHSEGHPPRQMLSETINLEDLEFDE